jgi:hypothetical protein
MTYHFANELSNKQRKVKGARPPKMLPGEDNTSYPLCKDIDTFPSCQENTLLLNL